MKLNLFKEVFDKEFDSYSENLSSSDFCDIVCSNPNHNGYMKYDCGHYENNHLTSQTLQNVLLYLLIVISFNFHIISYVLEFLCNEENNRNASIEEPHLNRIDLEENNNEPNVALSQFLKTLREHKRPPKNSSKSKKTCKLTQK